MIRWWRIAACAVFGTNLGCESDVTVHLLKTSGESSTAGRTGAGGESSVPAEAGETGEAGGGASSGGVDSDSSVGQGGAVPVPPCQKIGPEVCNGSDDNCNGVVDEGCAHTVLWKHEPDGVILGHATGGVTFLQPCPDGSVLVGFHEGMGTWLDQVSASCRQIELHTDETQSPVHFSVTLGPRVDTPYSPATSLDPKNQMGELLCPDGLVLSGVDGTTSEDTARYILAVRITCAPPIVATPTTGPVLDSDRTQEKMVGPVVCAACTTSPVYNFTTTIGSGHVATGLFGGDGLWVDRVGFRESQARIVSR